MAVKNLAVFGIYPNYLSAELAVDSLRAANFRNTDISVLFPEHTSAVNQPADSVAQPPGMEIVETITKAPQAATTGTGSGAVIGGTLGWLAGIGALVIPGIGPFIAAGPVVAALAGAGVGGALGGIGGALLGFGISEVHARAYAGRVGSGGILLSVHCDDEEWSRRAQEVMQRTGAEDISTGVSAAPAAEL